MQKGFILKNSDGDLYRAIVSFIGRATNNNAFTYALFALALNNNSLQVLLFYELGQVYASS